MTGLVDRILGPFARLLPTAESVGVRRRRAAAAVTAVMLLALALHIVFAVIGTGGSELADTLINTVARTLITVSGAVLCALNVRRGDPDRRAWLALAIGLGAWVAGNSYWDVVLVHQENPPIPSLAHAGWLLFYPFAYLCMGLHARRTGRGVPASTWLDGLVGMLAVAAVGVATVVTPIVAATDGSTTELVVNAAYPIGDVLLLALVVAFLGLAGGGRDRAWTLLGSGFALFAAADTAYLYRLADGITASSPALKSLWLIGIATIALAPWQRPVTVRRRLKADWRILALPLAACTASIGLLLAFSLQSQPGQPVAASFAAAALVVAMVRTSVSVYELRRLAETSRQASTDELTGLPNRRWFDRELRRAIDHARVSGDELALLVIDLDHFKELNDTLGHHAGDEVLRQIGPRLAHILRGDDTLARLGGDEFAVVLAPGDEATASAAGLRLRAALERPFEVGGIRVHIDASVGIALFPQHARDALGLLQRADVAMYEAKRMRTGHEVYLQSRDRHSRERLHLVGELHGALETGQLVLHYQPKADVRTGVVSGVEALVRWQHPERGLLGPGHFLPLVEQSGLTRALTSFVLDRALHELGELRAGGLELGVAVNLGPADLLDLGLPSEVERLLRLRRFAPERLELEVSEDVVMADVERTVDVLRGLRAVGVKTALDDFGAGHAAVGHLKQLDVDTLKIDCSFVMRVAQDERDAAIVHSLVDLGRRLGLRVVAEGVETREAWELLARWGCDEAQGYLLGRPMPADELAVWMRELSRQPHVTPDARF